MGRQYFEDKYEEYPIRLEFKYLDTLEDLKSHIKNVYYPWNHFLRNIIFEKYCSKTFYLNGCAYAGWYLDETGIVCVKNDSNPYIKRCVAKSLPE